MAPADELVLVSGATGYIGSWVVFDLLAAGYRVRGTVRDLSKSKGKEHLQRWIDEGLPLELVEASLLDAASWRPAVHGCTMVAHVASPFFVGCPESEAEEKLYGPARQGTLNVLEAAFESGTVKKVVLTSSVAAVTAGHPHTTLLENPEDQWTNMALADPYSKSKTMAERAAWDFIEAKAAEKVPCFTLATINPALVIGPPLSSGSATSHELPFRLINRKMPLVPSIRFGTIDVRDIARGHRLALEKDEAAGHRFVMQSDSVAMNEMGKVLREAFHPMGYNPPTRKAPYAALWLLSHFDSQIKAVLPTIGKGRADIDCSKVKQMLGIEFIPSSKSIEEHCHGCLQAGVEGFQQTPKYKEYLASETAFHLPAHPKPE
mmetsp:Transcript_12448/g.23098  ORF Transcript_12448/g.23098 Transcript_12448/m.23098 type:complete len:376 (-) Transcript_12448:50-1177(-)